MAINRGDVFYIEKSPTAYAVGHEMYAARPGIIVSENRLNDALPTVSVVYLTTQPKQDAPYHVTIRSLKTNCTAICEQVFSVDKARIGDYYGTVNDREMIQVSEALAGVFALNLIGSTESGSRNNDELLRISVERDIYRDIVRNVLGKDTK